MDGSDGSNPEEAEKRAMSTEGDWGRIARRLTEAAAQASARWVGKGENDVADAAAVEALENGLRTAGINATIVIGEGEKDDAPYLVPGTTIGPDTSPALDIAVDPLEGTTLVAEDRPGALSVLALAPAGALMPLGRAFYMKKLIGPPAAADVLRLEASPERLVPAVAEALGVVVSDLRVAVQERPRHDSLVASIRDTGAQVHLFGEGDLSFALLALQERGDGDARTQRTEVPIDLLWGIGGAPEGILSAAAQRVLGGAARLQPAPRSEAERRRLEDDSDLPEVVGQTFRARDLVQTDRVVMALTGVTDGPLLGGIRSQDDGHRVETLLLTPDEGRRRVCTTQ